MPSKTFNEKVWDLLKLIPEGKVTTYKAIADALNTKAYRAVGNACNKNPHSPVAACHRVVNINGSIGGFSSGTREKIKLLEKEGIAVKNGRVTDFDRFLFKFTTK